MGKDLRKLNKMIETYNEGPKTDLTLMVLVYEAYMLGLEDFEKSKKVEMNEQDTK